MVTTQQPAKAVKSKSGFAVLAMMSNKSADLVGRAIDQTLSIHSYFADPYCSRQSDSNENFHGLLRQYIPKDWRMETPKNNSSRGRVITCVRNQIIPE